MEMKHLIIFPPTSLLLLFARTHAYPSMSESLAARAEPSRPFEAMKAQTPQKGTSSPYNTDWMKDFTAVGDSYAAAIGAGSVLGGTEDADCSRYDAAYSAMMSSFFSDDSSYQSLACSGDLSGDVRKQAEQLKDNSQDLITISAGGNDALLSDVLAACIYTPAGQSACDEAVEKSQDAIDHELHDNIVILLETIAPKMKDGGMAVYTLYAQFFNAETDECSEQTWNWFENVGGPPGIKLSKDLRSTLNRMVNDANKKIKGAIAEFTESSHGPSMTVAIADWDAAAGEAKGRFCEEGSAPDEKDPSNAGLLFQRLNTQIDNIPSDKRKVKVRGLDKRAPDAIARVFHPTPLGQRLIATYALMALIDTKKHLLGGSEPQKSCTRAPTSPSNEPTCKKNDAPGITKEDFKKAREAWCKDTSKSYTSEETKSSGVKHGQLNLEFEKSDGATCPESDCNDALAEVWNACAAYASRPDGDDSDLQDKYGPLNGEGTFESSCGTYTYSLSSPDPTTTSSAEPTVTTSFSAPYHAYPKKGEVQCAEYSESYKKCWHKVKEDLVEDTADAFYGDMGSEPMSADTRNRTQRLRKGGEGGSGVNYLMSVGWIPGCDEYEEQYPSKPMGEDKENYQDLCKSTYYECRDNNDGLGGYVDVGCIRYGFYPNNVKGADRDQAKFWAVYPDICG